MTALQQEIIEAIDDEIDYLTEIERIIRIYVLYQDWMVTYDTDYWIEVMIVIEQNIIENGYYNTWEESYQWYVERLIKLINNYIKYSLKEDVNQKMENIKQLILQKKYEEALSWYKKALEIEPDNRTANAGLNRIQSELQGD